MAKEDPEAEKILDIIGKTKTGLPTSSLPKVSAGLGIDPNEAHDALFDCRYMVKTLEKALAIVSKNQKAPRRDYVIPRISTDRYIKMKNKGRK
jgi:DNA polymerase III epsilon subunit-like protein